MLREGGTGTTFDRSGDGRSVRRGVPLIHEDQGARSAVTHPAERRTLPRSNTAVQLSGPRTGASPQSDWRDRSKNNSQRGQLAKCPFGRIDLSFSRWLSDSTRHGGGLSLNLVKVEVTDKTRPTLQSPLVKVEVSPRPALWSPSQPPCFAVAVTPQCSDHVLAWYSY